jgi:hypothetical protein
MVVSILVFSTHCEIRVIACVRAIAGLSSKFSARIDSAVKRRLPSRDNGTNFARGFYFGLTALVRSLARCMGRIE